MQHVRAIEFDDNGVPVPVLRQPITGARMTRLLGAALTAEYVPQRDPHTGGMKPGEERFIGLTNIEVGALKQAELFASGDTEAAKFMFDRIVGKPKQQTENLNVNVSLQDYLAHMAQQTSDMFDTSDDTADDGVDVHVEDADAGPDLEVKAIEQKDSTNQNNTAVRILVLDKFAALDGI